MKSIVKYFFEKYYRSDIKKKRVTIISNNCWGSFKYQQLKLPYNTPFVGLFLVAPDYIKMLQNIDYYLKIELTFTRTSKYFKDVKYPIGLLNDIEIHFLHYKDIAEAKEKWNRRLKRINWNAMYFKFSDSDLCDESLLKKFDALPFKNKVCFTAKEHSDLACNVWLKEQQNKEYVEAEWNIDHKYFDLVNWLNH